MSLIDLYLVKRDKFIALQRLWKWDRPPEGFYQAGAEANDAWNALSRSQRQMVRRMDAKKAVQQ